MSDTILRITGLSRQEAIEVREEVPGVRIEPLKDVSAAGQHEPISVAVILAVGAVSAFTAWILKDKTRRRIKLTVDIQRPDGSKYTRTVDYEVDQSLTSEQTIEGLKALLEQLVLGASGGE